MPAHRGFPQVGGHSFVPFWHKNTPGGCSVFYAVYSGGSIASTARQLPEADTVLLKKALAQCRSSGGQQLSRGMSLCGTMIFVARRFGFSMWLMVWLAASMPSW